MHELEYKPRHKNREQRITYYTVCTMFLKREKFLYIVAIVHDWHSSTLPSRTFKYLTLNLPIKTKLFLTLPTSILKLEAASFS